jgi:hypothetical protein
MSAPEHQIPALTELRDDLREAARRDIAARAPRRRRRRALFAALGVLLGGAAVAGAADLISTGEPVAGVYRQPGRYQPANGLQIAVKAHDEPLAWGVTVYKSRDGQTCALAGRVRGVTLGELRGGTFHPYARGRAGVCGRLDGKAGHFQDTLSGADRTVVYGRVRPGVPRMVAIAGGKRYTARTGKGGAFMFVFKGRAAVSSVEPG